MIIFQTRISNLLASWEYGRYEKIQNFSLISLQLWLLGQKKQGCGCEYHYRIVICPFNCYFIPL